uniref:Circadian-associated transcriptional repressor-like n=2 Tax=Salmo trutta TaxID=8032 RepID=A0A673ZYP1_SALTR
MITFPCLSVCLPGLSSFQESVAMDRIQRIMGVLQNPNMGERYVSVILKLEAMLHSWFPQVRARRDPDPDQHNDSQEEHHTPATRHKQYHAPAHPPPPASPPVVSPPEGDHHPALRASDGPLPGSFPYSSATHLKCLHTVPICSSKTETETAQQEPPGLGRPSTACSLGSNRQAEDQEQTQDDAVSSSTDPQGSPMDPYLQTQPYRVRPRAHRRGPPSGKISSPCLERLLQSKESIIAPRNTGGDGPGGGEESSRS